MGYIREKRPQTDWSSLLIALVLVGLVLGFTWWLIVVDLPRVEKRRQFVDRCIVENKEVPEVLNYCDVLYRHQDK